LAASFMPNLYLKPALLGAMVTMALIILVKPSAVIAPEGSPVLPVRGTPKAWLPLFIAGIYGGFVQAGVGFILIAAIAGALRYDLVRTNALKMLATLAFTGLALSIFIWRGQVMWLPGLVLAVGTMAGAALSVRFALQVSQATLKWFLFVMTLAASVAAFFFG